MRTNYLYLYGMNILFFGKVGDDLKEIGAQRVMYENQYITATKNK